MIGKKFKSMEKALATDKEQRYTITFSEEELRVIVSAIMEYEELTKVEHDIMEKIELTLVGHLNYRKEVSKEEMKKRQLTKIKSAFKDYQKRKRDGEAPEYEEYTEELGFSTSEIEYFFKKLEE